MVRFYLTKRRVRYSPMDHLTPEEFKEVMNRYDKTKLVSEISEERDESPLVTMVLHLEPEGVTLLYKGQIPLRNLVELYGGETKHRAMAESKLKQCVRSYLETRCIEDIE